MADSKTTVENLLSLADIKINGSRPFDIKVNDERVYDRIMSQRDLGLGESYMDGWWDVKRLDQFVERLQDADLQQKIGLTLPLVRTAVASALRNRQTVKRARHNASHHYDIGNDLYERMLDKRMIYSCAYWAKASSLDEAQETKLDLICRKLYLKRGMTVLDIGCGWGGFAEYVSKKYHVKVTGITPAAEQVKIAKKRTKGLDVKILQKDYRHMSGSFDRIVSIGMLEHVGPKNYKVFFNKCRKMLKDEGLMLHHTIGGNKPANSVGPWMDKYIFPGAVLPTLGQISDAIGSRLIIEDLHSFGPDYAKTLMAWHANFVKHYPEISDKYDERFYRMWNFYLLACAGSFRARNMQLWQIVMRKREVSPTYISVR